MGLPVGRWGGARDPSRYVVRTGLRGGVDVSTGDSYFRAVYSPSTPRTDEKALLSPNVVIHARTKVIHVTTASFRTSGKRLTLMQAAMESLRGTLAWKTINILTWAFARLSGGCADRRSTLTIAIYRYLVEQKKMSAL